MYYTISQAAEKAGLPATTLRYYDKEGLLPFVHRGAGGARLFVESDFEWLRIIHCLRYTGMRVRDIRTFITCQMDGGETNQQERLQLLQQHRREVLQRLQELESSRACLETIIQKCEKELAAAEVRQPACG